LNFNLRHYGEALCLKVGVKVPVDVAALKEELEMAAVDAEEEREVKLDEEKARPATPSPFSST
jgi:hypothetical protein